MSSASSIIPAGFITNGSGALAVGTNSIGDFWNQYTSDGVAGVLPNITFGRLGITTGGECTDCDYCLCPQCEWCLPNTSPAYVTVSLSGWVSDLKNVQIIGDPNQTWDLGVGGNVGNILSGFASLIEPWATAQQGGICQFHRTWWCDKPFTARFNAALNASTGAEFSGITDSALDQWVDLWETGNDGLSLTLVVTYGGYYTMERVVPAQTADLTDTTAENIGLGMVTGPVISVAWILGTSSYGVERGWGINGVLIGQGVNPVCPAGSATVQNCTRCTTECCTDLVPYWLALFGQGNASTNTVTRLDCSQTYTLNTSPVFPAIEDGGQTPMVGTDPGTPSLNDAIRFGYGGIFTAGATTVTGNQTFPTTWFPVETDCPSSSIASNTFSYTSGSSYSYSYSNSAGSTEYSYSTPGEVLIPPIIGPGGGPGPGPGGGPPSSTASSGCLCEIDCPSSLETTLCGSGSATAGPLVPCYNSGLVGKYFQWTDGNCYFVTSIKNSANATYAPTQTFDTCDECNNSNLYIQLFECCPASGSSSAGDSGSGGAGELWCYVPVWIASGWNYYNDGTRCWYINASNPRKPLSEIGPNANSTVIPTAGITSCTDTQCGCNKSTCMQMGSSGSFTATCNGTLTPACNDINTGDNSGSITLVFNGVTYTVSATNTGNTAIPIVAGTTYTWSASGSWTIGSEGQEYDADGGHTAGPSTPCDGQTCAECVADSFPGYTCPCGSATIFSLVGLISC